MPRSHVVSLAEALARRRRMDLPEGWRPIYDRLVDGFATLDRVPGLTTVGALLGRLHLRLASPNEAAQSMIDQAVGESLRTCQVCGEAGSLCRVDCDWACRCERHGHPGED